MDVPSLSDTTFNMNRTSDPNGITGTSGSIMEGPAITPRLSSFAGITKNSSVSNSRTGSTGPGYEILFTPKRIESEDDIIPPDLEEFYYKHLANAKLSRTGVQIVRANAESHVNFESTRTSAKNSTALLPTESPSHLPAMYSRVPLESLVSFSSSIQEPAEDRSRSSSLRRIRWGSQPDFRIIYDNKNLGETQMLRKLPIKSDNEAKSHIPPELRVHIAQRLLQIKDLIVEIVAYLRSTGYGGKDFQWSPQSLRAYGITNIPVFKIPEAFQKFTVNNTLPS